MRLLSWELYRALNIYRPHWLMRHPAYVRDRGRRATGWIACRAWLYAGTGCLILPGLFMAIMAGIRASWYTPCFCLLPIALILTFMPLWTIPLGLTFAPVITRERTHGTWDLLRISLLDLETLIAAKTRRALDTTRPLLNYLVIGLGLMGLVFGLVFAILVLARIGLDLDAAGKAQCALIYGLIGFGTIGLALFLVDRVQQILCMGIAALAAGSHAQQDTRGAMLYGMGAAFAMWLGEYVVALAIMRFLMTEPEIMSISIWTTLFTGPATGFLLLIASPWRVVAAWGSMIAVREVVLHGLWQWALVAAQRE